MAKVTEITLDRLHLSLVNWYKDYARPNPGIYTFDKRAQGKGTWVCTINTGYNWELFPNVNTTFVLPHAQVRWTH